MICRRRRYQNNCKPPEGGFFFDMLYHDRDYKRCKEEEEEVELGRSAFRRDFGRLLHSPSFRRLQGKTQLFPGDESDFFRNRLTHSLEVAQIAKGIAQQINAKCPEFREQEIDLDAVEFAGLAHDLGHPPFGHNGEKALDECMKQYGGFEGNAQTLRILSRVEKKVQTETDPSDPCGVSSLGEDRRLGLNLTYRSLAAILKYDSEIPEKRDPGGKLHKGYYASEKPLVDAIKQHVGMPEASAGFKTIECQIMDIADDIAYSTYDLEDAMKGGFTHPMQLLAKVRGEADLVAKLLEKVKEEVEGATEQDIYVALNDLFPFNGDDEKEQVQEQDQGHKRGALEIYTESKVIASDAFMRSAYTSQLVGNFMRGIGVESRQGEQIRFSQITVERGIRIKIEALKHLNYLLTIMSPRLKVVEYRGEDVVKTIFETLVNDAKEGYLLLPDDVQRMYRRLPDIESKMRLVCDFVAGMTDRYAVEFYSRLRGAGASIFKPI